MIKRLKTSQNTRDIKPDMYESCQKEIHTK